MCFLMLHTLFDILLRISEKEKQLNVSFYQKVSSRDAEKHSESCMNFTKILGFLSRIELRTFDLRSFCKKHGLHKMAEELFEII